MLHKIYVDMFKDSTDLLHELWVRKPVSRRQNHTAMNYTKSEIVYNYTSSTTVYFLGGKVVNSFL